MSDEVIGAPCKTCGQESIQPVFRFGDPVKVPQGVIDFALAVAKLADSHGLEQFEMKVKPKFELTDVGSDYPETLSGMEMLVFYSNEDGRGRQKRNLIVSVKSETNMRILRDKPSHG
jgi:hypothetical protein